MTTHVKIPCQTEAMHYARITLDNPDATRSQITEACQTLAGSDDHEDKRRVREASENLARPFAGLSCHLTPNGDWVIDTPADDDGVTMQWLDDALVPPATAIIRVLGAALFAMACLGLWLAFT